jgi:hypothetical protein
MQDGKEARDPGREGQGRAADGNSRPQQAGEAGTTRFGMEEGDNSDIPATGPATRDEEGPGRPS